MRIYIVVGLVWGTLIAVPTCVAAEESKSAVLKELGSFNSPTQKCPFTIQKSSSGDFKQLVLPTEGKISVVVDDFITAAFLDESTLVYSAGPANGHPGIFVYNCRNKTIRVSRSPQNNNAAYPAGSDYFEIQSAVDGKIFYYYAPNYDLINWSNFYTNDNLYYTLPGAAQVHKVLNETPAVPPTPEPSSTH